MGRIIDDWILGFDFVFSHVVDNCEFNTSNIHLLHILMLIFITAEYYKTAREYV